MTDKLRLGGMAMGNGLLVHGPTHWAAAVRRRDGEIEAASGRKPRLKGVERIAGVRGVVRLGEAMLVIPLVKRALPEAKLPFSDVKVLGTMAAAAAGGRLLRGTLKAGTGTEAIVAAVGPDVESIDPGDKVLFPRDAGFEVRLARSAHRVRVLRREDLLARIHD